MSLSVAIVADDLTGALDSSTPFVLAGHPVAVAVEAGATDEAIATGATVVAVNTASRSLPPGEAAAVVGRCAEALSVAGALVAFKKVDSRLKGNVAAEVDAALTGFGRARAVVAPAVPSEGRTVVTGHIVGRGIAEPIDIRARLGALAAACEVPDTPDQAAVDRVAGRLLADRGLLGVGARGLALGLARAIGPGADTPAQFTPRGRILFAIGSRDPITLAAVDRLMEECPDAVSVLAPDGRVPRPGRSAASVTVLRTTEGSGAASESEVAARFAEGVVAYLDAFEFATVVLCGGDTASAVLRGLAVRVVRPRGEIFSMPWFEVTASGRALMVVTKSGGFGAPDVFARLAEK